MVFQNSKCGAAPAGGDGVSGNLLCTSDVARVLVRQCVMVWWPGQSDGPCSACFNVLVG